MPSPAALSGTFADFKLVKTRSAAQIIIEVPIEQADHALAVLGGIPQFGKERHVALARLTSQPDTGGAAARGRDEPSPPKEMSRAQRAGMLCGDARFRKFLSEQYQNFDFTNEDAAAFVVRDICGVKSRSEIDGNKEASRAWSSLYADFQAWLHF